eukprot:m.80750 g.80750  ORF g.80750 m.80750 type:complete len:134 (+) comp12609_c1_seq3:2137-2538(+)
MSTKNTESTIERENQFKITKHYKVSFTINTHMITDSCATTITAYLQWSLQLMDLALCSQKANKPTQSYKFTAHTRTQNSHNHHKYHFRGEWLHTTLTRHATAPSRSTSVSSNADQHTTHANVSTLLVFLSPIL